MNPKTYQVKLRNFLGPKTKTLIGRDSYTFEIHAANYQEALDWVTHMFDGIDMEMCADSIIDCDAIKKYHRINGKQFIIEKPEGYYRSSPEEVAVSLCNLVEALSDDYAKISDQVKCCAILYENFETDSHLKDLNEAKEGSVRIKTWLVNLLNEFPIQCNMEPMREEVRRALLDAVSKIAAQV